MTPAQLDTISLRDLIPMRTFEIELKVPCETAVERLRAMLRGELRLIFNYWKGKGEFFGTVVGDQFRIRRNASALYTPVVLGRVVREDQGCRLSLRFIALEGLVIPLLLLLAAIIGVKQHVTEATIVAGLMALFHIPGCINFRREMRVFFEAANMNRTPMARQ